MKKSLFQKLIILLFALPALACALTGGDEPTATPTAQAPAATAEVNATAAATEAPPTPTPEPEPTVDLSADFVSYTSPETGITISHPADWAVQDFFVLLLATDETFFDAPGAIQNGAGVVFAAGPADEFESTDPVDLANEAVAQFELSDDATITEGPTALTIQGQPAAIARVEGTPDETGIPVVGLAVVVINGDRVGVGLGVTPAETESEYLPLIEAMFNTMVVGEPIKDTQPTGTDNPLTLEGYEMISVGDKIAASLDENGQKDFFFNGQADGTVTISVETEESNIDLVIEIFDADLNWLLREDYELVGDPEAAIFNPPENGTFIIRVSDNYGSSGGFNITVEEGITVRVEPVLPTIDPDAIPLDAGELIDGALTGDPLQYVFTGTTGQPSTIFLSPVDDWDPTLTILGPDGTILVDEVDDGFPGEPEAITYIPETDGDFILLVDAFFSPQGSYNIFLLDPETAATFDGVAPEVDFGAEDFEPGNHAAFYRVCVPANAFLVVFVEPEEELDVVVDILGGGGGNITDQTDNGLAGEPEAVILSKTVTYTDFGRQNFEPPDFDYVAIIAVGGFGGQGGSFTITITSTSPEGVVIDGC
jgi:hypothetical protein